MANRPRRVLVLCLRRADGQEGPRAHGTNALGVFLSARPTHAYALAAGPSACYPTAEERQTRHHPHRLVQLGGDARPVVAGAVLQ
eukprot:2006069-Prymnesium_polylepis.1